MTAMFQSIDACRHAGFEGFLPVGSLRATRLAEVPQAPGVYLILVPDGTAPTFLARSPAGHSKGRNPTVTDAALRRAWVPGARAIYIGKAATSLRIRLRAYLAHGAGRAAGHWGGRFIWQLTGADALLVAWREESDRPARIVERELIARFEEDYGRLPFANRVR